MSSLRKIKQVSGWKYASRVTALKLWFIEKDEKKLPVYNIYLRSITAGSASLTGATGHAPVNPLRACMHNGLLHVAGLTAGEKMNIYSVSGALVYQNIVTGEEMDIILSLEGVYSIQTGKRTLKVLYYK